MKKLLALIPFTIQAQLTNDRSIILDHSIACKKYAAYHLADRADIILSHNWLALDTSDQHNFSYSQTDELRSHGYTIGSILPLLTMVDGPEEARGFNLRDGMFILKNKQSTHRALPPI